jgi:hypothetical protein
MFAEANTKTNLPAQIDLYATAGSKYDFLFMAKGGGSANKTYLYQKTKALLNPSSLMSFLEENIKTMYARSESNRTATDFNFHAISDLKCVRYSVAPLRARRITWRL